MDDYMRERLKKIDEISDAVIYIKTKIEILDKYETAINKNTEDINNVGKKVRHIELEVENLSSRVEELKKQTQDQAECIDSMNSKGFGFAIKVLAAIVTALAGAVIYLLQKLGVI